MQIFIFLNTLNPPLKIKFALNKGFPSIYPVHCSICTFYRTRFSKLFGRALSPLPSPCPSPSPPPQESALAALQLVCSNSEV